MDNTLDGLLVGALWRQDCYEFKALLEVGANPNARNDYGDSILLALCKRYHNCSDELRALIAAGVDLNDRCKRDGCTALHYACYKGDVAMVAELIEAGMDVNVRNKYDATPLHEACKAGDTLGVVRYLLKHIEVIEQVKDDGEAIKVIGKEDEMMNMLSIEGRRGNIRKIGGKREKAAINQKNSEGRIALHCVCASHRSDSRSAIAEILIEEGENVNEVDNFGNTPLHYACKCGDTGVINLLLKYGANLNVKNKGGEIPLCMAAKSGIRVAPLLAAMKQNKQNNKD